MSATPVRNGHVGCLAPMPARAATPGSDETRLSEGGSGFGGRVPKARQRCQASVSAADRAARR
jgi:hypothetical protein